MDKITKYITAVHETGHAFALIATYRQNDIKEVSIKDNGINTGVCLRTTQGADQPHAAEYWKTPFEVFPLFRECCLCFGGLIAENVILGRGLDLFNMEIRDGGQQDRKDFAVLCEKIGLSKETRESYIKIVNEWLGMVFREHADGIKRASEILASRGRIAQSTLIHIYNGIYKPRPPRRLEDRRQPPKRNFSRLKNAKH